MECLELVYKIVVGCEKLQKHDSESKMKNFIRQLPTSSVEKRPYFADIVKDIQTLESNKIEIEIETERHPE